MYSNSRIKSIDPLMPSDLMYSVRNMRRSGGVSAHLTYTMRTMRRDSGDTNNVCKSLYFKTNKMQIHNPFVSLVDCNDFLSHLAGLTVPGHNLITAMHSEPARY